MAFLAIVGLMVVSIVLWQRVAALRDRVAALELDMSAARMTFRFPETAVAEQPTAGPIPRLPAGATPPDPAPQRQAAPTPEPAPVTPIAAAAARSVPARRSAAIVRPAIDGDPPLSPSATTPAEVTAGVSPTPPFPPTPVPSRGFEDMFGRRLPIWAGGITLAVAGFLIVKYSIDAGLLSPLVRVIGGLLFGGSLIAGAEAARRGELHVRDPRIAQALSGAGIATLYADVLVAANLYHIVGPFTAFGGLVLVTLLAAALSLRFGAPSAVLGLVGGLAAPALVGEGAPDVPLLSAYLALAVGGLGALGRTQRWWWLGASALLGGFGWGLLLLLTGTLDAAATLSIGAYLLLLGVALPILLFRGDTGRVIRALGSLAACAQIAVLVALGGYAPLHWGLFALLGAATVWQSRREAALADLPAPALTVGMLLAAAWPHPTLTALAEVIGGGWLIFGLPATWRVWRADGRLSDAGAVAALAGATLLLPLFHLADLWRAEAATLALGGAAAAAMVAALGWRSPGRRDDARFPVLVAAAAALLAAAMPFALEPWAVAPAIALVGAAALLLARPARDDRVEDIGTFFATIGTLLLLVMQPHEPIGRALGVAGFGLDPLQAVRWLVPALVAALLARRGRRTTARPQGAIIAVLVGYGAAAQVVPTPALPLVPAAAIALLGWRRAPLAASVTAAALAVAWAAWPLGQWLVGLLAAAAGTPLYVTALPVPADTAARLVAPAFAGALLVWRHRKDGPARRAWIAGLAVLGAASAHIFYKQLFAIGGAQAFAHFGYAERSVWEAALALIAAALWRRGPRVATAIGAASLAHFAWFSLLLHDPLWAPQAVGVWPFANWLLPAYAVAFALVSARPRLELPAMVGRARGWAQMLLILLFAATELRQLVHGSFPDSGHVHAGEDIMRSLLAIALAVGFLQWGIRRQNRDWRIASLVMMLAAVAKVFLLDAAGLDGLARIGSFLALGFSLIGIGWLYSRYLPEAAEPPVNPSPATA